MLGYGWTVPDRNQILLVLMRGSLLFWRGDPLYHAVARNKAWEEDG